MRNSQKKAVDSKTVIVLETENNQQVKISSETLEQFVTDWPKDFLTTGSHSIEAIREHFIENFPDDGNVTFMKRSIKLLDVFDAFVKDIICSQNEL